VRALAVAFALGAELGLLVGVLLPDPAEGECADAAAHVPPACPACPSPSPDPVLVIPYEREAPTIEVNPPPTLEI
jgi:hypothetical protein